jgi:ribosome-interacting GTPase 1
MQLNLDYLVEKIWENLNLIKILTKKRGHKLKTKILQAFLISIILI